MVGASFLHERRQVVTNVILRDAIVICRVVCVLMLPGQRHIK